MPSATRSYTDPCRTYAEHLMHRYECRRWWHWLIDHIGR